MKPFLFSLIDLLKIFCTRNSNEMTGFFFLFYRHNQNVTDRLIHFMSATRVWCFRFFFLLLHGARRSGLCNMLIQTYHGRQRSGIPRGAAGSRTPRSFSPRPRKIATGVVTLTENC